MSSVRAICNSLRSSTTPLGLIFEPCALPQDVKIVELKQCENCTRVFTRPKARLALYVLPGRMYPESVVFVDTGIKHCPSCRSRMLLPEKHDEYQEELQAGLTMIHRVVYLPHYDESLVTKRPSKPRMPVKK